MLLNTRSIIIAFFLCLAFTSCQKEQSEENGNSHGTPLTTDDGHSSGTAAFTLAGAPNTCTDHIVNGDYHVGVSLTAANTVAINVNVTSIGTYTISTAVINGIGFYATGTFNSTGSQTIILVGSGTPLAEGSFNYKPGTTWCSFPVTVTVPVATGSLDCSSAWSEGVFRQGVDMDSTNKLNVPVNVTGAGSYSIQTAPINGTTFSGSGMLNPGAQTIVLTGVGRPEQAGSYLLEVSLGTSTCSFWVTFQ